MNNKSPKVIKTETNNPNKCNSWGKTSTVRPIYRTPTKSKEVDIKTSPRDLSKSYAKLQGNKSSTGQTASSAQAGQTSIPKQEDGSKEVPLNRCNNTLIEGWNKKLVEIKHKFTANKRINGSFNESIDNKRYKSDDNRSEQFEQHYQGYKSHGQKKWKNKSKNVSNNPLNENMANDNKNPKKKKKNRRKAKISNKLTNLPQEANPTRNNGFINQLNSCFGGQNIASNEPNCYMSGSSLKMVMNVNKSQPKGNQSFQTKSTAAVCAQYLMSCVELSTRLCELDLSDEELMATLKYAIINESNGDVDRAAQKIIYASQQIRMGAAYSIQHPKEDPNWRLNGLNDLPSDGGPITSTPTDSLANSTGPHEIIELD